MGNAIAASSGTATHRSRTRVCLPGPTLCSISPRGPVLTHDAQIRTIDWETQGPRSQADVRRMTGYFWQKPDCYAFGAFTPSLGVELYHVADPLQVPE